MKACDRTNESFETKAFAAAKHLGIDQPSAGEVAALKHRINLQLFDHRPSDLSVAQIADWMKRLLPAIRRSNAALANHGKAPEASKPVTAAPYAPPGEGSAIDYFRRLPRAEEAAGEPVRASDEVLCSIVSERPVRFNPVNMVVTPMRVAAPTK